MDPASAMLLFVLFQAAEKSDRLCRRENCQFDDQAHLGGIGGKSQMDQRQRRHDQTLAGFFAGVCRSQSETGDGRSSS